MMNLTYSSLERAAGLILVLVIIVIFPGFIMFWLRRGYWGGAVRRRAQPADPYS